MNVHFFRGIKKSFPTTRTRTSTTRTTTTTNKPFLRPRQRSLAVKNTFLKVYLVNHLGSYTIDFFENNETA